MKKIVFLLVVILVACGSDSEQYVENIEQHSNNAVEQQEDSKQYAQDIQDTYVQRIAERFANRNQLTPEDFLYDLEFLARTLEENFPFLGVVERRFGNEQPLAAFIPNRTDFLTSASLATRINNTFRSFGNLAHLDLNPNHHWRVASGGNHNSSISTGSRIIEEGRIALIVIPTEFFEFPAPRSLFSRVQEVQNFIGEIQGYEHIILDLRHIGGGFIREVVDTFLRPNIQETLKFREFAFIMDGEMAYRTHTNLVSRPPILGGNLFLRNVPEIPLVPAREFAEQNNLIDMNAEDLENLAYGFILETLIDPIDNSVSAMPRKSLFADNIWLLIGSGNFSAAEIFSRLAKEAGFILVGQEANNRNSWGRVYFSLPRTENIVSMDLFYITDNTGRNTEEFPVEPHYFNRPGMDALDTVLAIIAERSE